RIIGIEQPCQQKQRHRRGKTMKFKRRHEGRLYPHVPENNGQFSDFFAGGFPMLVTSALKSSRGARNLFLRTFLPNLE
ncbi:MAG: hypothetical protein WC701_09445, partial [Kiritimatiellales bacterium]